MNIVLIGYRGSGKTSVGRAVAEALHRPFVDTDERVCERFGGVSIAEIWRTRGEAAFRAAECEVVAEVMSADDQVVGLGGGTLEQPAARAAVEAADARRFYLHCPAEVLADRIAGDGRTAATRPDLTKLGGSLEEVRAVLERREPTYRAVADHVLDAGARSVDALARSVVEAIR